MAQNIVGSFGLISRTFPSQNKINETSGINGVSILNILELNKEDYEHYIADI